MPAELGEPGGQIKVLQFVNTVARGGVEEHVLTLLRGLDRRYFRLLLVCMPELAEKLRRDVPPDVETREIQLDGIRDWRGAAQLWRLLRKWRPHVLHSHMFQASRCASPLGRLCGVPAIVETTHVRELWRKGRLKGSFVVDRAVGRSIDYFIAVSAAQRQYLAEEKGLPPEKIVVIHNGANIARFDPRSKAPEGLRASLNIAEDDPIVLVLARLEPQKGHEVLLAAIPEVRREFPGVRVICAGDGSLRETLRQRTRELGLEETVRFVGYQSNPADWLALADFAVLPSHFEGLPITSIESLAMEKPMVATAVDGTAEVIIDGKTGLTVPPGDPARLAQAMCRMLRDSALRLQLGRAGRSWVEQHFGEEEQVRKTGELYLRALGRSKASAREWPPVPAGEACGCAVQAPSGETWTSRT